MLVGQKEEKGRKQMMIGGHDWEVEGNARMQRDDEESRRKKTNRRADGVKDRSHHSQENQRKQPGKYTNEPQEGRFKVRVDWTDVEMVFRFACSSEYTAGGSDR